MSRVRSRLEAAARPGPVRGPALRARIPGAHRCRGPRGYALLAGVVLVACVGPARAGPPYVTDDPEPTDTGHFENYLYVQGTRAAGAYSYPGVGIEINYGAYANTQVSVSVPLNPNPGPGGLGLVWEPLGAGVKYRFIAEDPQGWRPQVSLFPQVFTPVGSAAHDEPTTEFLPVWIQKSVGRWTTFGGAGYTRNPGTDNRNFVSYGWGLQRQVTDRLALGAEVFGETRTGVGARAATAAGIAALYDFNELWHVVGSLNAGIRNAGESDRISYNEALKWTP